jgi:hypothetical protein
MDPISLDRFDLPDKQTISVKIPSTYNQVPRLDFRFAGHSMTVLMSPRQSNSALSPPSIPGTKRISSAA